MELIKNNIKPYKALVIEDNPGDFFIVESYLQEVLSAPVIIRARNFKNAAAVLSDETAIFDIILLDLTLPDNSGQQLVNDILQLAQSCPVIILTGYGDIEFSIQSIAVGISDYLIKDSLNQTILYKSIAYAIERKKSISALIESEIRYSDLFHLSPQPTFVYAADSLLFLDANNAAIKHYGYQKEEFLAMGICGLIPEQDKLAYKKNTGNCTDSENFFLSGHHRHQKKNADIIEVEIQRNSICFNGKKATLLVVFDITERLNYIGIIEAQNKRLSEIAWMQSHVIRAPLSRMLGITDLIKNYALPQIEKEGLLAQLLNAATELDNLIRDIAKRTEQEKLNLSL